MNVYSKENRAKRKDSILHSHRQHSYARLNRDEKIEII